MNVDAKEASTLPFVVTWLILIVLAGLSVFSAFAKLAVGGPVVQFGLAASQAAIIFILFMRLKGPPTLKWVFAGAGFFWLIFLYGLSMTDYATRQGWPTR